MARKLFFNAPSAAAPSVAPYQQPGGFGRPRPNKESLSACAMKHAPHLQASRHQPHLLHSGSSCWPAGHLPGGLSEPGALTTAHSARATRPMRMKGPMSNPAANGPMDDSKGSTTKWSNKTMM
eukprot:1160648-Pelagomonas_calceolata.AAC.9